MAAGFTILAMAPARRLTALGLAAAFLDGAAFAAGFLAALGLAFALLAAGLPGLAADLTGFAAVLALAAGLADFLAGLLAGFFRRFGLGCHDL